MPARPSSPRGLRCFVAVDLAADVRRSLADRQRALTVDLPSQAVRWVRPDGTHLTLKFLGDVAPGRLAEVESALRAALQGTPSLEIEVGGLGCFPSARRPRVLWVGIRDGSGGLAVMQRAIEDCTARLGFEREGRPFQPHLTLGRVHEGIPEAMAARVGEAVMRAESGTPIHMPVRSVKLYRSELRPGGAVYTVLWETVLEQGH